MQPTSFEAWLAALFNNGIPTIGMCSAGNIKRLPLRYR